MEAVTVQSERRARREKPLRQAWRCHDQEGANSRPHTRTLRMFRKPRLHNGAYPLQRPERQPCMDGKLRTAARRSAGESLDSAEGWPLSDGFRASGALTL